MKSIPRVFARPTPLTAFILFAVLLPAHLSVAQQTDQDQQSGSAVCTFEDGRQISARYTPIAVDRSEGPPIGRVWIPGGSAVALFTDTEVTVGDTPIPTGAYTLYLIPGKRDWTLIVSKNVTLGSKYNEQQDLVRAAMETGTLSRAEPQLKIFFGHTGSKQCEMNVDYGKIRAWVEFREK